MERCRLRRGNWKQLGEEGGSGNRNGGGRVAMTCTRKVRSALDDET